MNIKYTFSGILLVLGIICGCKKEGEPSVASDAFSISYLRSSFCVGYNYQASINNNGLLQISENNDLTGLNRSSMYH